MEFLSDVGFLIIGWVLGIANYLIVSNIQLSEKKKGIYQGICTELGELKIKFTTIAFYLGQASGKLNKKLINWCLSKLQGYKGPEPLINISTILTSLKKKPDNQIQSISDASKLSEGIGLGLKHYDVPFIKANIGDISIFSEKFQNSILNIKSHIDLFNEEVDLAMTYHMKTFDSSISDENMSRLKEDINNRYYYVHRMAKNIADKIDVALLMHEML